MILMKILLKIKSSFTKLARVILVLKIITQYYYNTFN